MRLQNLPQRVSRGSDGGGFAAVIFDMDGVVTDTASVHAAAWKALFDEVLPTLAGSTQAVFDLDGDYRDVVDGRTREDGVRRFLFSRGLQVPEGTPGDGPDTPTVYGLAARKQRLFADAIARGGVKTFGSTVDVLRRLRAAGVPAALVTSSRNSAEVLDAAGVSEVFTVRVDGSDAEHLSLAGKPDPAMFLEAARRLRTDPAEAVVVEDAAAGVAAGAAGGFGLVVGVDRAGHRDQLLAAGADVVVTDLAQLDLAALVRTAAGDGAAQTSPEHAWCGGAAAPLDGWLLRYDRFDPEHEGTREALCTLGNGYWATRGAVPGSVADEIHYPGTYLAGVYNRVTTDVGGRPVESEHLVNAPDWAFLTIGHAGGQRWYPGSAEMISHRQHLDLRRGTLTRINRYRDSSGRITRITSRRVQSQAQRHLAALETTVEAENWSGQIVVRSAINGEVTNRNVADDEPLAHHHLTPRDVAQPDPETVLLEAVTDQSGISIATVVRTRARGGDTDITPGGRFVTDWALAGHDLTVGVRPGRPVTIEKIAAVATSRDRAVSTAALAAVDRIRRAPGFEELLAAHVREWEQLWERFGIDVAAGARQRLALNLHIFHVLQTIAAAGPDLDAGVPARGLHGEGYRGHIFWDELFVYPLLTLRRPELTRALLRYRHRRLDRARAAARAAGLAGALFPWQSGSDGREETPTELLNLRNGQWMADNSHLQRHVGLGVAYSVWQYYQATEDIGYLIDSGAEIVVEVARLFASLAVHDPGEDRFDIVGVMGPDEFHDGYPEAPGHGLRNNAYTNVLASWVLTRAGEVVRLLACRDCAPLLSRLGVDDDELSHWDRVSRRLRVPFHDGVISQFEGYERLAEFDWDRYRRRYGNIGRLDLILQAEGDSTNNYRLSKQADVLMLFYLFSAEELRDVFTRLGYELAPEMLPRTVHYYLSRTSHGSTLSRLVHSWVLARTDRARSWSLFTEALEADLSDTQSGTTRTSIHLGAMAGTADMVIRCYAGVETRADVLRLHPRLPRELGGVSFQLTYRGQPISIDITTNEVRLHLHPCSVRPIQVCVDNVTKTLAPGDRWEQALPSDGGQPDGANDRRKNP